MSWVRSGVLAVLLLGVPCAAGAQGVPESGNEAEARREFDAGVVAYREGNLDEAIRAFEACYRLNPNPFVLFNVGKANLDANRPVAARKAFERYLREVGGELKPDRIAEVNTALAIARSRTSELLLEVTPPRAGVQLSIDQIAAEPAEVVAPGPHVVRAAHGEQRVQVTVHAVAGEQQRVALRLPLAPAPPPAPVLAPPPTEEKPRRSVVVPVIVWGASALLVSGAVVSTVLWAGASGELEDIKARETTRVELDDQAARTNLFGGAAIALGGGAGVGIALATWLTVRKPAASSKTKWAPAVGLGYVGARASF